MIKQCETCGKLIENCGNRRKFCSEHQKLAHKKCMKEYRLRNIDRICENEALLRKSDKVKKQQREHYLKNKEKINTYYREWCKNNKDKRAQILKKYSQTNNGIIWARNHNRKRRALRNNVIEVFTTEEWLQKVMNTEGICPGCGSNVGCECLTLDHIQPISKVPVGFTYTINNVQPLCKSCNCSKGDR